MLKKKFESILQSYGCDCILHDKSKKHALVCIIQPIKTNSQNTIMNDFSNIGSLNNGWYQYFCGINDVTKRIVIGSIITVKNQSFIVKKIDVYTLGNDDIYQMGVLESAYFKEKEVQYVH